MRRLFLFCCLTVLLASCAAPTEIPPTQPPSTATGVAPSSTPIIITATLEPTTTPTATVAPSPTFTPAPSQVRFAVIGDYGEGNQAAADVAALVHGWAPDLVITVGDNNYPSGAADTIDARIGQYYQDYIFPYTGAYGPGADVNRFFPSPGNHDWVADGAQPYLDYFTLPGNERYYDFVWGPVHFFALDSDEHEPDGVGTSSAQAAWFQTAIAASTSTWNIVYFHHAPYSSGYHGSTDWMRWPFAAWGADAVLSGHDHTYERLLVDGIPYFVNGLGGGQIYLFNEPTSKTQYRYNSGYGAMLVTVNETEMLFEFTNRAGELKDSYRVTKP
jgi:tartrate-resistant acid phosphatase type 5